MSTVVQILPAAVHGDRHAPGGPDDLSGAFGQGVHVTANGAKGDGVTDDSAAFTASIAAAAPFGFDVYVPNGTYVIDTFAATSVLRLTLAPGATLKHKIASTNHMIVFTGTDLSISGGRIDGQQSAQGANRRYLVSAPCPSGTNVVIDRVEFINSGAAAVYTNNFGGNFTVTNCRFSGMKEHDGVSGHWTAATYCESGQAGQKGRMRFNHNTVVGTNTPAQVGGAPGGLFLAPTLDYVNGIGNFSTLEAIGNWFWGIGQNCSINDIAPIHFYPSTDGARVIGNYFEQSGFTAIAAKSVQNFVCIGNVIVNGQVNAKNTATEGAIGYAPGYHAGSVIRPRAIISNNIIDNPGGQVGVPQDGIVAIAVPESLADDFIISNNIINGAGTSITVGYAIDGTISGNVINGGTGTAAPSQHGLQLTNISGDLLISGNRITAPNGHGIQAQVGLAAARLFFSGNIVKTSAAGTYAANVRGAGVAKFSGNTFDSAGAALSVTTDGTNPVWALIWDESNTVRSGSVTFTWASITAAQGQLFGSNSPLNVVTPALVGTTYRQTNGTADGILWMSQGVTAASWVKVLSTTVGPPSVNRLLGWTFDPALATTGQPVAAAGVLYLCKILLSAGGVINNVSYQTAVVGTGLVAGQCFIGVYDAAGNLIGQTADQSAQFMASGIHTSALTAPTVSQSPGAEVFVGLLWNGTTGPQLRGNTGTSMANIGITQVTDQRYTTTGAGLTALPGTLGTKTTSTSSPFMGVA